MELELRVIYQRMIRREYKFLAVYLALALLNVPFGSHAGWHPSSILFVLSSALNLFFAWGTCRTIRDLRKRLATT